MNRQTIWEIACQLIRMQTLYHAGTMKPVSQLKGAIQETGENNVCAGGCCSMKLYICIYLFYNLHFAKNPRITYLL